MSKPVVRVVLAVLISLAIIAAIAPSVQARLGSMAPNANIFADGQALGRTSISERASGAYYQFDYFDKGPSGGCDDHSNPSIDD